MEELNGRMIACQILIAGLIARVANDAKDPLRFISDFRDEIHARRGCPKLPYLIAECEAETHPSHRKLLLNGAQLLTLEI